MGIRRCAQEYELLRGEIVLAMGEQAHEQVCSTVTAPVEVPT